MLLKSTGIILACALAVSSYFVVHFFKSEKQLKMKLRALEMDRLLVCHRETASIRALQLNKLFVEALAENCKIVSYDFTITSGRQGEEEDGTLVPWPWSLKAQYAIIEKDAEWRKKLDDNLGTFTSRNAGVRLNVEKVVAKNHEGHVVFDFKITWEENAENYQHHLESIFARSLN